MSAPPDSPISVMGIDLSGRTTGVTAVAWLEGRRDAVPRLERVISRRLRGDRGDYRLRELAVESQPAVVAIDAPLALPHAVTCRDEHCSRCFPDESIAPSYSARRVDGRAAWSDAGHTEKGPMPTAMIAAIAFRGIYLKRLLERERIPVIETWPMGTYRCLRRDTSPDTQAPTDITWRRETLAPWVADLERAKLLDELDAVAAALAGYCHVTGTATELTGGPSTRDEGSIVIGTTHATTVAR